MQYQKEVGVPLINAEPPEKASPLTKRMLRKGQGSSIPRDIRKLLGIFVGKSRPHRFRDKSMRRGVQIALEARQRPTRLAFIAASQRQGIEIAAAARAAYLKRRAARWRGVVEKHMPAMFIAALTGGGFPLPVGPETREKLGGFDGPIPN